MDNDQIKKLVRDELANLIKNDKYIFDKHIQMLDGRDIQTGRTTGTKIGTNADQKVGFFGEVPVVQQTRPTNTAEIIAVLTALGLTD